MRFENMEKEDVNGNIHFNFGAQGKGLDGGRRLHRLCRRLALPGNAT